MIESLDSDTMMALCANQISKTYLNSRLMYMPTAGFVAPYQKSTSGSDFDFDIMYIHMSFCISLSNFVVIDQLGQSYDIISILKMAA